MPAVFSDDFYALLGVDAAADAEQLRNVWRKLARQWHPDRAGPAATAKFQKLSAAYEVLSDPVARASYDQRRSVAMRGAVNAERRAGVPRRAPAVMISRLCGALATLLRCGIARRAADGVIELLLTTQEAAQGGMAAISMRVQVRQRQLIIEELFSAWLAIPPQVAEGALLVPSVLLPGMLEPVRFRVRIHARRPPE